MSLDPSGLDPLSTLIYESVPSICDSSLVGETLTIWLYQIIKEMFGKHLFERVILLQAALFLITIFIWLLRIAVFEITKLPKSLIKLHKCY